MMWNLYSVKVGKGKCGWYCWKRPMPRCMVGTVGCKEGVQRWPWETSQEPLMKQFNTCTCPVKTSTPSWVIATTKATSALVMTTTPSLDMLMPFWLSRGTGSGCRTPGGSNWLIGKGCGGSASKSSKNSLKGSTYVNTTLIICTSHCQCSSRRVRWWDCTVCNTPTCTWQLLSNHLAVHSLMSSSGSLSPGLTRIDFSFRMLFIKTEGMSRYRYFYKRDSMFLYLIRIHCIIDLSPLVIIYYSFTYKLYFFILIYGNIQNVFSFYNGYRLNHFRYLL